MAALMPLPQPPKTTRLPGNMPPDSLPSPSPNHRDAPDSISRMVTISRGRQEVERWRADHLLTITADRNTAITPNKG